MLRTFALAAALLALQPIVLPSTAAAAEYEPASINYFNSYDDIDPGLGRLTFEDFEDEALVPGLAVEGNGFYFGDGAVNHNAGVDRSLVFFFADGITGFAGRSILSPDRPIGGLRVEALFADGTAELLREAGQAYGNGFYGFTSSKAVTGLVFSGANDQQIWQMLDVRFGNFDAVPGPAPAVPEPASWAMLISGFGFAGSVLRRGRRQTGRRGALASARA